MIAMLRLPSSEGQLPKVKFEHMQTAFLGSDLQAE